MLEYHNQPLSKLLFVLLFLCGTVCTFAQPSGFSDQLYLGSWSQATGLTFDDNGRMYVYEKGGKVWVVENGVKLSTPLVDISEEVGNWRDFGLVGFALDPNFLSNGHIYLLYIVDRHHLLYFGTPSYSASTNEYFNATIGRITRYTATAASNFTQVDYSTRQVLFGESVSTGMPSLHESHGTGELVFGTDGSLLATLGDGASYSSTDEGSASETYYQTALNDNIIRPDENVGAYRCQKLNSFNGKIIRIDPATGNGLPSNPFYNSSNPRSAQSRTFALGVRNSYKMCLRPGTGSHLITDGDPGDFYFGDVGWGNREELNVLSAAGQNFGWPKYEGMTYQPGYNNSTYAPSSHERPKVDWRNTTPRVLKNGTIYNIGSAQFPGTTFQGNASTGGTWYTGNDFPAAYKDSYFHADYGQNWIRRFKFDANNEPQSVHNFMSGISKPVVALATSPIDGGLYYVAYPNEIRKVSYVGVGNQAPVAVADSDLEYGNGPLTVQFTGDQSYDPEGSNLTYNWNFGDGTIASTTANPMHIFTATPGSVTTYTVTLTVTDQQGQSANTSLKIFLNNAPPVIQSTSIDNRNTFSTTSPTNLNLSATVTDANHPNSQLDFEWMTSLYHNNHNHDEAVDNNATTTTQLSPLSCDEGATYWYRIHLRVTDPEGLSATYFKDIYPNCSGTNQTISFSSIPDKLTTSPSFNLTASANSGLPLALYVVEGPATISGNTVTLNGTPGEVTIRATQGGNGTYKPARPVERSFLVSQSASGDPCSNTGQISREVWQNVSGTTVADIPLATTPDIMDTRNIFEIPVNAADNYGTRLRGYICPPTSGNYTFYIASDDNSELYLSTNDDPANKVAIADVPSWTNSREWNKFPSQQSSPIALVAGQTYYIEALQKEQTGGDNLAVGWRLPNGTLQRPIPGNRLAPWNGGATPDNTRPAVHLSALESSVDAPFTVYVNFSEAVSGLSLSDFSLTNATVSNLSGSGQIYTLTMSPTNAGTATIRLPGSRTTDAAGNTNTASNTLSVNYTPVITCDNVTSGGSITGAQSVCGSYDPTRIDNSTLPSGGSGTLQYRWQYSTAGTSGPWTNISGATGANYNPPTITATRWYRRQARRSGCTSYARSSNVIQKEVKTVGCGGGNPPTGYCAAQGNSPWTEWISRVEFGSIDNSSAKDLYGDYTNLSTPVAQGNVYPITLTPGLSWPGHQVDLHWRVWIDFNRDGDFEDSGELVLEDNAVSAAISGNIVIPASTSLGQTRMRIAAKKDSHADPCGSFQNGEVEDYLVDLQSGSGGTCFIYASSAAVTCDNNGTNQNTTDDLFTFDLQVNGANTGSGWTTTGGSGNYGQSVTMGPYPISGGAVSLTIRDADDATCTTSISVQPPSPCSSGGNPPGTYCASQASFPWQEWIQRVQFRTIDNNSTKEGYGDFTSISTTAVQGASYPIRLEPGLSWSGHLVDLHWRVWIDFNRDGDFNDSGEKVVEASAISQAMDELISIPANAQLGPTRMRISMKKDSYANPCENFTNGEVEDYAIVLIDNSGGGDITSPTVTLSTSSNTVTGAFDVNVDFDENVSGLTAGDFTITNGTSQGLTGNGSAYTLSVRPTSGGTTSIRLPANKCSDAAGNGNLASNTLNVIYNPPSVPTITVSYPASGLLIDGATVEVFYDTDNLEPNADNVLLTLDSRAPVFITNPTGYYVFTNVPVGNHTLLAEVADDNENPLSNPEASFSVSFTTQNQPGGSGYCNAKGDQPWQEWIQRVRFGTIDNSSTKDGYGDYTGQSTSVNIGSSYTVRVTPDFSYTQWDEHIRVWIDFNGDDDFADAGELVMTKISTGGAPQDAPKTVSANVTIPASAVSGTTRMRVSMKREANPGPCEAFTYGEVEDYSIQITGSGLSGVIPEFLEFEATSGDRVVDFNWTTNSEYRNQYFILERATHEQDFVPYKEIASTGQGHRAVQYAQTDDNPAFGENRYRLKQVFEDGTFEYSPIRMVDFKYRLEEIAVFPNPTSNHLYLALTPLEGRAATVKIYNNLGTVIHEIGLDKIPAAPADIDVSKFSNGLYHISIEVAKKRLISRSFIINRLY